MQSKIGRIAVDASHGSEEPPVHTCMPHGGPHCLAKDLCRLLIRPNVNVGAVISARLLPFAARFPVYAPLATQDARRSAHLSADGLAGACRYIFVDGLYWESPAEVGVDAPHAVPLRRIRDFRIAHKDIATILFGDGELGVEAVFVALDVRVAEVSGGVFGGEGGRGEDRQGWDEGFHAG